jgi:hypothetical protein
MTIVRCCSKDSGDVQAKAKEDIYLGKGRFIKDDPKKYPSKTELTGGWAGGEAALWELRDEIKVQMHSCSPSTPSSLRLVSVTFVFTSVYGIPRCYL